MDDNLLDKVLAYTEGEFRAFCETEGLAPPVGPVDKYGSYVFETGASIERLNRYIAVALMPEPDSDRIRVEFQYAVDDGWRYTAESASLPNDPAFARDVLAGTHPTIAETLQKLWIDVVLNVMPEDLAEEYVVPRTMAVEDDTPAMLDDFEGSLRCENGHDFPAAAGICPSCLPAVPEITMEVAPAGPVQATQDVPTVVRAFISRFVAFVDNGKAPRSAFGFGYPKKIGIVNHIPVCRTLTQLTNYFNSGHAAGSTHFGIGRETADTIAWEGDLIPCARVHQYMPIVGAFSPWAQGNIQTSASCDMPPSPTIAGMQPGEPNEAFVSIENVAMTGRDGVTEAQFNSNVMLRAFCAAFFGHDINPRTQLWHSEIDQKHHCFDPGWSGALEDTMQDAANRLLHGDTSGLLGLTTIETPRAPSPFPDPARGTSAARPAVRGPT